MKLLRKEVSSDLLALQGCHHCCEDTILIITITVLSIHNVHNIILNGQRRKHYNSENPCCAYDNILSTAGPTRLL